MLRKKKKQIPRHKKYRQRIAPKRKGRLFDITLIALSALVLILLGSTAIRLATGVTKEIKQELTILRVQIANGSGINGAAGKMADWVKKQSSETLKYDVIDITNFEGPPIPQTIVLVRDSMALSKTDMISQQLGIPKSNISMSEIENNFLALDITIVVGKDYEKYESHPELILTEVLNGCGIKGAANQFAIHLTQLSDEQMTFEITKTENFKNFDVSESMILIKTGKGEGVSARLARKLDIKENNIIDDRSGKEAPQSDLTIVVGHDWGKRLTASN
ncbi:MAG: LytR C-terminal domain-containing protein [candidate division Zixibacteria bacterium]|nr:LytR C-terminal domain-containing protein [candidate division Zixibacteria bacterium]NIR65308.1 LytR C-terminal domain-containing protein [candidate division Zixibacteria bacterium]NIS16674.1 LytR C-terminal domain-containing protein [candidate division Zixibacteria bacterium]NIS47028.1 LytR C-terminal domain-containing protein [candidate division Zixibacteria bacterium]NIT51476.1 LytR C-terminal domain-containing protein [candidate division Zixibacteria bacterium]